MSWIFILKVSKLCFYLCQWTEFRKYPLAFEIHHCQFRISREHSISWIWKYLLVVASGDLSYVKRSETWSLKMEKRTRWQTNWIADHRSSSVCLIWWSREKMANSLLCSLAVRSCLLALVGLWRAESVPLEIRSWLSFLMSLMKHLCSDRVWPEQRVLMNSIRNPY